MRGPDEAYWCDVQFMCPWKRAVPGRSSAPRRSGGSPTVRSSVCRHAWATFVREVSAGRRLPPRSCCGPLLLQGALHHSQRAAVDRATGFQPAVPLVSWASASTTPFWSPTTFTKNRDRLLAGDIAFGVFSTPC